MTITLRNTKGSALTYGEVDENFRDLRFDTNLQRVLTNGNSATTMTMTVNTVIANTVSANVVSANQVSASVLIAPYGTPASATASGTTGQIVWDGLYIYVCISPNTWRRSTLAAW